MHKCWLWTEGTNSAGYGFIKIDRFYFATHVLSFEHHKGKIPAGFDVMHSEFCTSRSCWRPAHLFVGSHRENVQEIFRRRKHGHR